MWPSAASKWPETCGTLHGRRWNRCGRRSIAGNNESVVPSEARDLGSCPWRRRWWRRQEPRSLALLGMTRFARDDGAALGMTRLARDEGAALEMTRLRSG